MAAVLVASISALLRFADPSSALLAAGIAVLVVLGTAAASAIAIRQVQHQDREALYSLLAAVLPSGGSDGGLLRMEELLAIERSASQIWVYAYDLAWERETAPLPDVVRENLERGVRYRYIVPPDTRVLGRVRRLQEMYRDVGNVLDLIEFRMRGVDVKLRLVQFGITIYNPSILPGDGPIAECLAAFFPHYKSFGPEGGAVFVSLRGDETLELQEGFSDLWEECEVLPWRPN